MSKKFLILMSVILVVAMLFTGCSSPADEADTPSDTSEETPAEETGGKKILRSNNSSEPGSLDPALAQGTHESWVLENVFEGLMTFDEKGELVPGMAESYEISDDELTYTFTLRDGVKWSNGDPVTAEDFEFTWKRALDPELAADYANILYYIKGGEAYNTGQGSRDDVAVKALDEKTLEVTLESPTAYFLELTAFYTYFPVNKNVVESNPDWAKKPETHVSNGPFKLVKWEHNAKLVLEKNESYYNADKIKLDGIDLDIIEDQNTAWQKYEGGEYHILVDVPTSVVAQLQAQNDPELEIGAQVGTYYYNVNPEIKPFNNVKVRKALSMALDRETIVKNITQGGQIAAEGVVSYGLLDETGKEFREGVGSLIEYDPEGAKALLEEGLAEEGMSIEEFSSSNFVLLYNTSESHKKIAQAAQEMWRTALGIEIGLENVEFQVKLDREKSGDYQISRAGWIGDFMDPMTFLDLWASDSSFNDVNYNNPEYDALLKEAKSTIDQDVRMESMRKAEKMLMEDMPVLPVYFYTQPYTVKSNVSGIIKVPVRYPVITYADIAE
ncbi:peptide ABC transporter substrate-binding protein [Clostridium sp. Cult1]|jgi:oligopeptide transport system substrate-binding protein|uniref:peptide ABC transporter substrate-binding protein n=1 Tax=Clostridium sp. Cult1 TaxID=2079002 RepID=UPI001F3B41E5|nr:peptide ABC transporter substrate-binding protein [Clostridium sp. Cult1]MCF6462192.1 peptide ABC transporter substrate-binding protein [Clostridium sp. Cult1]